MIATLIIVGNEITRGIVQDNYVRRIGNILDNIGIIVECAYIINDSKSVRDYISLASKKSDIIITTGGLGPTQDDVTRDELSSAIGRTLVFNNDADANIKNKLVCSHFSASNNRQALIPQDFQIIYNENGTAPGFYGVDSKKLYICLPGPPKETDPMLEKVRYVINDFMKIPARKCAEFSLYLIAEARFNDISQNVLSHIDKSDELEIGTCFHDYKISLYIYYSDEQLKDRYLSLLRKELSLEFPIQCLYAGDMDIVLEIKNLLLSRHLTISTAESITGGYISKILTDMPGSSQYFKSGIVSYSNEVKIQQLHVSQTTIDKYSEVSLTCAREMAVGCKTKFDSDLAISVTGYAGPDGKNIGQVFIGVACNEQCKVTEFKFVGSREYIRRRTAVASLLMTYRILQES